MNVDVIKLKLFKMVRSLEVGEEVIRTLFPNGSPLSFETELWDFKRKPPLLIAPVNEDTKEAYKLEVHELIKDIVSFHNSFGGFIIFGVEDSGSNRIVGCDSTLDLDDISRRLSAHTGRNIQLYQDSVVVGGQKVLVLLIPRRLQSEQPVSFVKAGPSSPKKKSAYSKNSTYIRVLAECRPAENSSDDWTFLFSERILSSAQQSSQLESIPTNLPPRDPDMVQFVGREEELANLRSWIVDRRSPVKLISGIGGLGKTSVAYYFCEELAKARAGDYEYIAWVSAKKSTFAALRGQMVKTTRHDFSTVNELLQQLVKLIAGESSIEDDQDEDELAELLTDALAYLPSFIVVDDLDSLSPEEQRKCAMILQQIGFRTVDRDHASSKFLLTSRLDQGLSPTSVVKIGGLTFDAFDLHIQNLCQQFQLPNFPTKLTKQIFNTSSGSPLFASAIVRMSSLGENPKDVCESWSSSDGEDVREFAFKRELDRLEIGAASVLFAVVKLGDVTFEELLDAIEVTKKSLQDYINQLQSFHLLGRKENKQGDIVLSTSKELISSAGILRNKLGPKAQDVERRCAIIRKNQGDKTREVGRGIRKIVRLWEEGDVDAAVIVAEQLVQANPKNGDAWCALAGAHLKTKPKHFQRADTAASNAVRHSCNRDELFGYVVMSKQGISDWQGLKSYADRKRFKSRNKDDALEAYLVAVSRLIDLANERGKPREASSQALDGIKKISEKIHNSGLDQQYFNKLVRDQNRLADDALRYRRMAVERPRDHLDVANLAFDLVDYNIQTKEVVAAILDGLTRWSEVVKKKEVLDEAEADIISNAIRKLERLEELLPSSCKRDVAQDIKQIVRLRRQLGFVGAEFS